MATAEQFGPFYAHSTALADQSNWHLLRDHLTRTGEIAARNAAAFGGESLARACGVFHDLGKYTREFQDRLRGEFPRMDHSTWGARIVCELYGSLGQLLAYSIAGHHAGLANGREGISRRALQDRLTSEPEHRLIQIWRDELSVPAKEMLTLPSQFKINRERIQFQQAFIGRMLFSCLVDADFIDTDDFYRRLEGRESRANGEQPTLGALRERLNDYLRQFSLEGDINRVRSRILAHVRAQAGMPAGLFSLTVPTGGGKTLASLAFALDHAIRHGHRRIIFVIPFTSIVEQNAAVFRRAFGDLGKAAVLEHHSAFIDDRRESREREEKLRLAMENWDSPIVVTTAVQFLESLFADRPARCRKLHNIAGSVVIFDEAQTLPLKLLRPSIQAIDELVLNYNVSAVLCTATQPALSRRDGFRDGFASVHELAHDPRGLYESLRRVRVRHIGMLDDDSVAEHLRERDQVLCIVNNRRHARALYRAVESEPGASHLTTLMCARHRSRVLLKVRERLNAGEPCRLISTSLIEAGVDIDFATVLRAEAGLDSIAQAAGRCNREGRRPAEMSEVLVFSPASEWQPPPEVKKFADAFREIARRFPEDPLSLEAIREYFQLVYWQRGDSELDYHDLLGQLRESRLDSLPFETLAKHFRVIETAMLPVIVPYDEKAEEALEALEHAERVGGIATRLQPYLVQLPQQAHDNLLRVGAIQAVAQDRYGQQFMRLINKDLYNEASGLSWDDPSFVRAEKLVI